MTTATQIRDRYTVSNLLKKPGEGERTSTDMVIKARARDMGGDFSVMEGVINPKELLAPHFHKYEDQLVYVITSELEFEVGGKDGFHFTAPAGSYVQKPRGILHAFWNATNEPCRYIELSGREGFEGFVDGVAQGQLKSALTAETDWGLKFDLDDILRLMKENNLTSLAMSEMPELPNFPDLPAPLAKLFNIAQKK
ncbi:Cupin 2 conserved barrel domain protein [[Leptolyngbya] sp. PCC 7376]|uniref:cupin domain-containing protein n=1 Tax=[Leptolyngbya] sp. PCC 7376 TaxID=111781 RepID=UPI00029EFBE4|nr:cupin domain-containing protein [[Leptolyngbya] sp. PCC 7376]AFY37724.1 Cupin 2 conserved barrel domain protein [[Leptolyngbya] sp. PCC 7376]